MQYLIDLNNDPYSLWQVSLILESFFKAGCEEDLLINLIMDDSKTTASNLVNRKNTFFWDHDIGKNKNFLSLGPFYRMIDLMNKGDLEQPFTIFPLDSILYKPVQMPERDYPCFLYCPDISFTFDECKKNVGDFHEWFNLDKDFVEENWVNIGPCKSFNGFSNFFFNKIIFNIEYLYIKQKNNTGKVWDQTADLGLMVTILQYRNQIQAISNLNLISNPSYFIDSNFLSYKDGFLPDFHKYMYKPEPPAFISQGDPLIDLSTLPKTTPASKLISNVASSYLKKWKTTTTTTK